MNTCPGRQTFETWPKCDCCLLLGQASLLVTCGNILVHDVLAGCLGMLHLGVLVHVTFTCWLWGGPQLAWWLGGYPTCCPTRHVGLECIGLFFHTCWCSLGHWSWLLHLWLCGVNFFSGWGFCLAYRPWTRVDRGGLCMASCPVLPVARSPMRFPFTKKKRHLVE